MNVKNKNHRELEYASPEVLDVIEVQVEAAICVGSFEQSQNESLTLDEFEW